MLSVTALAIRDILTKRLFLELTLAVIARRRPNTIGQTNIISHGAAGELVTDKICRQMFAALLHVRNTVQTSKLYVRSGLYV